MTVNFQPRDLATVEIKETEAKDKRKAKTKDTSVKL